MAAVSIFTMGDFRYTPVEDISGLMKGDHVAWKHQAQSGREYYHHAIVEANHKEDGFLNVIAYTKEGIGRSVIDYFDGLQHVVVQSKPSPTTSSTSKGYFGGLGSYFSGGQKPKELDTAQSESPQAASCGMGEDSAKQKREDAYQRAKSMIGKKSSTEATCEQFAFWCNTGCVQEPHDCPMCKTTGQNMKVLFR